MGTRSAFLTCMFFFVLVSFALLLGKTRLNIAHAAICGTGDCHIQGTVYVDGKAKSGEIVNVGGTDYTTNSSGDFLALGLNKGTYAVEYKGTTYHITVGPNCDVDGAPSPPAHCASDNNAYEIDFHVSSPTPTPTPNPTPTPTPTPGPTVTPTPTPSAYSISGSLYVDTNNDQHKDGGEQPYAGGTSTFSITGPTSLSLSTNTGVWSSGTTLPAGTYTVSYTSALPQGYTLTYPLNGPPPSFILSIGPSCSVTANDASCSNGNVVNVDFGITNLHPWYQSFCGDIRVDKGITDLIPANPVCGSVSGAYAVQTQANYCPNNPGVAFTGNSDANFNLGQASVNNWLVGGSLYSEVFKPVLSTVIRTSYAYMTTTASQSGIMPIDLSTICNLSNCTLPANLSHGLYLANGNVNLNSFTFPPNQNYVFLVNGDLTILGNISIPIGSGSTATFSVSGNIMVDKSVGVTATSTQSNLDGFYSSDNSFIVNSSGNCTDQRLNIAGSVVVNAALQGGSFQNNRDFCSQDASCPIVTFTQRPDLLLNTPSFIKHTPHLWQEVAP